ncbi:MAG: DNA cytosine methyltransferase [Rikenellaceae bacterium]
MDNDKLLKRLTHASLFSGIGGFDLAAEWAGFRNVFHCDYDEFCRQALEYHFPNSDSHNDITQTDFTKYRGQITVLSGGFPCQPFSLAGKRKGATDNRYLWPQMLRAIREVRPTWIIGENVAGITSMVLPSEGAKVEDETTSSQESDFVIEQICRDLEQEGYAVQPIIIPACAIGAPHRRDRVWIVAHLTADSTSERCHDGSSDRQGGYVQDNINGDASQDQSQRSGWQRGSCKADEVVGLATNPDCHRCHEGWRDTDEQDKTQKERSEVLGNTQRPSQERTSADSRSLGQERRFDQDRPQEAVQLRPAGLCPRLCDEQKQIPDWSLFPTQPPLYLGDDGIPLQLANAPLSHKRWRKEAVKASGNAIVPQVAYVILRHIAHLELTHSK